MLRDARFSPAHYARIGGILYLLIITAGLFAQFVRGPASIGELSFAVWLTVKGVTLAGWREITERSGPALL